MFLDKLEKNKLSIGKFLRAQKGLRKVDPLAKVIEMPQQLRQYTEYLRAKGMQMKNLQYALFYTKNGLPYPGLLAKQKILSNTIMLRVPLECLLTTKVAFFSQLQIVFQQNPKFFSKQFTTDWQDHILLAFLLFEYQKERKSEWYYLIKNLPKDIDYAIFWSEKELEWMEDKWMELGIEQQRKCFDEECQKFIEICKKYPQLFAKQTFSLQNIKWIQSHLVTRCFGKYFQYTTMVPFAQLFNHQCVDVYYSMDYKPGNPHTENQVFYQEKQLTKEEEDEMESSEGSYDAEDFYQDDQYFECEQAKDNSIKEEQQHKNNSQQHKQSNISLLNSFPQHPNPSIDKDIKSIKSYILTFINFNDSVSLNYLLQIFTQLQQIATTQINDEQHYQKLKQQLREIHSLNVKYVKCVKLFYSEMKSKIYAYGIKQKKKKQTVKKEEDQVQEGKNYFSHPWPDDKFDDFVMLCSTKDQFEKGSQVYFCYGRLPNKLLLLRYGIALQHNKYNHLFLRVNIQNEALKVNSFKYVIQNEVNMRKYKRFKLKRTRFCHQLLTYLRANMWHYPKFVESIFIVRDMKREMKVLDQAREMLIGELRQYKDTLQRNRLRLIEKGMNYHEYFCLVYKIENQQILQAQITMIEYANEVINRYMQAGGKRSMKQILKEQDNREKLRMQIMMEQYFRQFGSVRQ